MRGACGGHWDRRPLPPLNTATSIGQAYYKQIINNILFSPDHWRGQVAGGSIKEEEESLTVVHSS
jgi:hypothetical protein